MVGGHRSFDLILDRPSGAGIGKAEARRLSEASLD